jgi:hypothetical protein
MRDARRDVLAFASADARGIFTHSETLSRISAGRTGAVTLSCSTLFLLPGNGLCRTLAGARIGVGALAAYRQTAAMAQTAVAPKIHQPLDIHRNFAPEIALDYVVAVDDLTELKHFLVGELRNPTRLGHRNLLQDFLGFGVADAMDVLKRDHDALVGWYVDTGDTSHSQLLLVTVGDLTYLESRRDLSVSNVS